MNLLLKNGIKIYTLLILMMFIFVSDVYGCEYKFDDEDIKYLERMVETEAFGASVEAKINMANVAINRHKNSGLKLKDVITSPNQFCYSKTNISKETKEAIDYVLNNPDTTDNSTYFKSGKIKDTFFGAIYCFTDDSGTHYYKVMEEENEESIKF